MTEIKWPTKKHCL